MPDKPASTDGFRVARSDAEIEELMRLIGEKTAAMLVCDEKRLRIMREELMLTGRIRANAMSRLNDVFNLAAMIVVFGEAAAANSLNSQGRKEGRS